LINPDHLGFLLAMKNRRFSDQQLYALRNHIPIGTVIEKILRTPSKISHGTYRFRCPLCSEFNTAINAATNLARCFDCKKNFNPIDFVIAAQKIGFVEAVSMLESFKHIMAGQDKDHCLKMAPAVNCLPSNASKPRKSDSSPVTLASILPTIMEKKEHLHPDMPNNTDDSSPQTVFSSDRIAKLQQEVCRLSEQLDQLRNIIGNR
jgi:hypothetical protein